MNATSIEWCNRPETRGPAGAKTWNPIRARLKGASAKARSGTFCTRISPGCTHCYASTINKRFGNGLEFTVPNLEKIEFFVDERILAEPLKQKKPCTIFVGDMFDLFHESIPQIMIAQVLWTAVNAKQHTFQFLTKRAERMMNELKSAEYGFAQSMPPHMWFGVSVEDQKRGDERIPLLLQTPAAIRFLSVEPQLEAIDLCGETENCKCPNALGCGDDNHRELKGECCGVDWVICGGESGQGARPFDLSWAESLREQCQAAGRPFFMKQIGSRPVFDGLQHDATGKGGDMELWPESLRVREFPAVREAVSA